MTERERNLSGKLFFPEDPELLELKSRGHRLSQEFSALYEEDPKRNVILKELLGGIGEGTVILGAARFHYGCHTKIGKNCFINCNLMIQDDGCVTIGDYCNIGPNVTIVTPLHPMLPDERRSMLCDDGKERVLLWTKPVVIEDDCWLGASVTVCPGVTIGRGCVIGAGSVVTKDVPEGCFAAGVPAKVIRKITLEDTIRTKFDDFYG